MLKKSPAALPMLLALAMSLSACAHKLPAAACPPVEPPKRPAPQEELMRPPPSQSYSANAQLLFQTWRQKLIDLQDK